MEKDIPCERKPKESLMTILISEKKKKKGFKIKNIIKDREGLYIMIKGSIQEDVTVVNVYAPNIGATQYIRQTLTGVRGEIDSNTIIVGNISIPLSPMDRSSIRKQKLNEILDQMDLTDTFRTFHPNAEEHTFFSSVHGTCSRVYHILGFK